MQLGGRLQLNPDSASPPVKLLPSPIYAHAGLCSNPLEGMGQVQE
jgi:hypothetical protein